MSNGPLCATVLKSLGTLLHPPPHPSTVEPQRAFATYMWTSATCQMLKWGHAAVTWKNSRPAALMFQGSSQLALLTHVTDNGFDVQTSYIDLWPGCGVLQVSLVHTMTMTGNARSVNQCQSVLFENKLAWTICNQLPNKLIPPARDLQVSGLVLVVV